MSLNLLRQSSLLVGIFTLTVLLNSCGGDKTGQSTTPESTTPESTPAVQGQPIESTPTQGASTKSGSKEALEAGSYCYRTNEKTIQAIAELLVEPNQAVSGTIDATITNDAENYYSSYHQNFAGVLKGEALNASITTEIENDVQKSQEKWTLNREMFSDGKQLKLKSVNCEEIIALKENQKEESVPKSESPQLSEFPVPRPKPKLKPKPAPVAESTPPKSQATPTATKTPIRVRFPQGGTETTLEGNLASGQDQVYHLNADKGQDMYVKITTQSKTANFDVEVKGGEVIEQQLTDYLDFTLPVGGQYVITVHGGKAGADYSLNIKVQ